MSESKRLGRILRGIEMGASVLMILMTVFWTYWGVAEMYHEGWWGEWFRRVPYLVPIGAMLLPTFMAFRWPRVGGVVLMGLGIFSFFFFSNDVGLIGFLILLLGVVFFVNGVQKKKAIEDEDWQGWWWLKGRFWFLFGLPVLVAVGISAVMLPVVLTRVDDGERGARLIEGNGVQLVWAPEGPGWNWEQDWGGYPGWQGLALFGVAPVGFDDKEGWGKNDETGETVFATQVMMDEMNVCLFLNEEGTEVMADVQGIWRMPTVDELVGSLGRHGENAGCVWAGEMGVQVACDVRPDKESPLWATDVPVIYYWAAEESSTLEGYFVAFNGTVNDAYKLGGNPRHGYRCVKEP